jgi:signal transduction histidine kinase
MKRETIGLRHSGIECVGDVPWGTHFCQFYDTGPDLLDTLVPYFKAGLENNEFCMWVTSEPLDHRAAEQALRAVMPDFDGYVDRGAIEIIPHTDWYLAQGTFDRTRVLDGWVHKLHDAQARGFEGLRLTGNTFWLESSLWRDFYEYEAVINSVIGRYHMLALCTYSLRKCGATEVLDVVENHQFSLVKRQGRWTVIAGVGARCTVEDLRTLDHQLAQRTLDLEAAVQELQGFSYSVSHDLRSPLRAVDGYSRMLVDFYGDRLDAEGRRLLAVVRENAQLMGRIIDDILDYTRLGRIDLHIEPLDMKALVNSAWDAVAGERRGGAPAFQVGDLPATRGDRMLVRQILINLLTNALKATRGKPAARIVAGGEARDREHAYFVRDNGIGFDHRYSDRLFGMFQRLHSAEEFPGSGVGLAIVKRLVNRHGGRVWAEGKVGQGATFWFSLPDEEERTHG